MPPNFKAVGQTRVELHSQKIGCMYVKEPVLQIW